MILRAAVAVIVAAVASASGTWLFGWPSVPVIAAVLGVFVPRTRVRPLWIGAGVSAGWALLLVIRTIEAPAGALAAAFGGLPGVPAIVPVVLTLLLPFTLGWPAAVLTAELIRRAAPRLATEPPVRAKSRVG